MLFYHLDREAVDRYAAESSRTTHGAEEAVAACRILAGVLHALLSGASKAAALWCFEGTDSFEDAVLRATNLGHDSDTTAAVCGQLAGAYYGVTGIPERWLDRLVMRETIDAWAVRLVEAGRSPAS